MRLVMEINRNEVSEWPEFFSFGLETCGLVQYKPTIINRLLLLNLFPFCWELILTTIFLHIIRFTLIM